MAIADFYYPFDSIDGDRPVTAAVERRFWGALFNDGVVGFDGFALTTISRGVYELGPGVGIVGGMVGGIKDSMRLTVPNPTAGTTYYVVMRASTYAQTRNVAFTAAATTLYNANADQLDESGMRDLVLYRIDVDANGTLTVTDMRTYCTSFDAQQWAGKVAEAVENISTDAAAALNGVQTQLDAATTAIDAETAGLYGGAGRQGFINPQFIIDQHGGTARGIISGRMFVADRWRVDVEGAGLGALMYVDAMQDGARHALSIKFPGFNAGSEAAAVELVQNIEGGVRTFCAGGKSFTVSFDARADAATALAVRATQFAASGGAGVAIAPQRVNVTTAWARYSLTFTGTMNVSARQAADVLKVAFVPAWRGDATLGADNAGAANVYLANMQINEGTQALSCYARPYADELEACQRYYATLGAVSLAASTPLAGSNQVVTSPLPVTRRLYRIPDVLAVDRAGSFGHASVEVASGGWRHGLAWSLGDSSKDAPVFVVTNTDGGAVARVYFNSIVLDAEITD